MGLELRTWVRIMNSLSAAAIVFVAIYRLVTDEDGYQDEDTSNQGVVSLYFIIFGLLIVSAEFNMNYVERLFGFLGGQIGRGVFILMCGTLFLRSDFDVTMIIAIALMVIGIINIVIRCKNGDQVSKYKEKGNANGNANPKPSPKNKNKPAKAEATYEPQAPKEENKAPINLDDGPMIRV